MNNVKKTLMSILFLLPNTLILNLENLLKVALFQFQCFLFESTSRTDRQNETESKIDKNTQNDNFSNVQSLFAFQSFFYFDRREHRMI